MSCAGNDLARCLHWGGSFHSHQKSVAALLHEIEHDAIVALLDRWNVVVDSSSNPAPSPKGALSRMGSSSQADSAKASMISKSWLPVAVKSPTVP